MAARQTAHTAPFPSHPHRWSALPASANALEPTITRFWRRWQEQGRSTAPLSVSASPESREMEYVQVTVTRKTRALADGKLPGLFSSIKMVRKYEHWYWAVADLDLSFSS